MENKKILSSLRMGNIPSENIFELMVFNGIEIDEIKSWLNIVMNKQSSVKFLNGEYRSGKSFFLKVIEDLAIKDNFLVSNVTILPNYDLHSIYNDIFTSLRSKNHQSFRDIVNNWIDGFEDIVINQDEQIFFNQFLHEELSNSIKFSTDFILAIEKYYHFKRLNMIEEACSIMSWLCGEMEVSSVTLTQSNINELKFILTLSYFIKYLGYSGLVILFDDAENIMSGSCKKRDIDYTYIKYLLDLSNSNKLESTLSVFAGTPEWFEHQHKGIPSYEALDDRLKNVLDTDLADMRKPIFNLRGFDENNLKEIAGKLTILHEEAYNWKASDKINPVLDEIISIHVKDASLTGGKVTPRVFIRSFISVLDTVQQNQSYFTDPQKIIELFGEKEDSELDEDW